MSEDLQQEAKMNDRYRYSGRSPVIQEKPVFEIKLLPEAKYYVRATVGGVGPLDKYGITTLEEGQRIVDKLCANGADFAALLQYCAYQDAAGKARGTWLKVYAGGSPLME